MSVDLFDETQNKVLSTKTYDEFRNALINSNCRKCALCGSRTNIVADRGNPKAKIVFIGEAPGANEDLQGKAFVGRGGRLLDELLKEVGFDTNEDALIINVVKCRPPDNRPPQPIEAQTCLPYLKKQLSLVRPKVILLLGATALKHIFPKRESGAMKDQVGKFFAHADHPGVQFMVLFHPAYILRDPRKKPLMREHLNLFKEYWRELQQVER